MTDKEGKTNYEYNALNQLLHLENSIKTQDFSYDLRGNLTKITENGSVKNTYEFSPINRLTKATNKAGQTARYDYNGLGFRVGKQITDEINPTKNIGYVLDIKKQYHNLLQMTDDTKTQNYTWDYNVAFADDNAYLQDELGSPLRYLDATGTLIDSFGYDEFGVQTSGEHSQPFGYTGYTADNVSGTYFAQAREYRAEVGRFVSEDLIKGTLVNPKTLSKYCYCWDNPLIYVDLDGKATVFEGVEAHKVLQTEVVGIYGSQASVEFPVLGYPHSPTGKGFIDIVIWQPTGAEVYEIKPITQKGLSKFPYNSVGGVAQRAGYIQALMSMGKDVNLSGTSFNPDYWTLPCPTDPTKSIRYYTYPNEPGMIYWGHVKNKGLPQPVVVPELEKAKDPSFKIDWAKVGEVALGIGTCTVAGLGIAWLVGNNVSGIGILDDFLIAPAGALFAKGLGMCIQ